MTNETDFSLGQGNLCDNMNIYLPDMPPLTDALSNCPAFVKKGQDLRCIEHVQNVNSSWHEPAKRISTVKW